MVKFLSAIAVGFATGILSGFGIGGGTLLILYLTLVTGMDQHTAQGINLLYFLPTAFASLLIHKKNDYVNHKGAIPAVICGCVSAVIFSCMAFYVKIPSLKRFFGGFLIITGLSELFRKTR